MSLPDWLRSSALRQQIYLQQNSASVRPNALDVLLVIHAGYAQQQSPNAEHVVAPCSLRQRLQQQAQGVVLTINLKH